MKKVFASLGIMLLLLGMQARFSSIQTAPDLPMQAFKQPNFCQPATPSTCGQLRIDGSGFYDQYGPWVMHGVQFFLPQYGINGRTFWDAEYNQATQNSSLDYWLGRSQQALYANLLRIFVDLPVATSQQVVTPTSYATLYDFASRANARGMRLGISIHNSDEWILTSIQQQWIEGMLSYFLERDSLAMVAYINLDNEINNYCDPQHRRDCLANPNQAYLNQAIDWIRQTRALIKARTPQMLITVGMSTELTAIAPKGGVANYFLRDQHSVSLASLIDFLAPHNYGGRGIELLSSIREYGYRGPVVLEEYGFPTDPFPGSVHWTEGPAICRINPLLAACFETAPFYVETNLNALRQADYAGGVAWMLADIQEKELPTACDGHSIPSDLWTGLFAVGGQYCNGGTLTHEFGRPKATATRVCFYHINNLELCLQHGAFTIQP
ncbi:hypothetical protein [Herpetosiphon giganteus]|uniref:hypothetical protein n=1 Tax=Herpetosiphon giganteus TaxID=2029754 RepID=UPI0019567567|nr:hypothetical protein [Herpetosiphon giganteus]MBM7846395.1 hypothetical protein [Herpetosiphon giganteus]